MPEFDITKSLKQVRNSIADEDNAFSMENTIWFRGTKYPEDSFKGACGTPACILGWSYHHYLKDNDLKYTEFDEIEHESLFFDEFAEKFKPSEFQLLVMPIVNDGKKGYSYRTTPEWFTRARTVAMLDKLLGTGKVNWLALEEKEDAW